MNPLPQTLTPENLGKWITENAANTLDHTTEEDLDDETTKELEHKSSMASRAIDDLKAIKKTFDEYLTKGTPVNHDVIVADNEEPKRLPMGITIPPTKGIKELTKNREFADQQLRDGVSKTVTTIYLIPVPEDSRMAGVDIEGNEWEQYNRPMTDIEDNKYGKLFKKKDDGETVTQFPDAGKKNKKKKKATEEAVVAPEVNDEGEPFI